MRLRTEPETYARAATLAPTTYDAKARTIDVEVTTENPVLGMGGFYEILSHDSGAVDLSRFVGAPFLNAHKKGDARDVLGVVTAARIERRKLIATVKLTRRDDAAGIIQDILDGVQHQTSAGYFVSKWGVESINPKTGARTRTATRWRPFEVSVVPYAGDTTRVRSEFPANSGANVRTRTMKTKKKGATANPAPTDDDVVDNPAVVENDNEPTVAETRAEIRTIIKRAGGTAEQADDLIDQDATVEQARAAAYDLMTARTSNTPRVRVLNPGRSPEQVQRLRAAGFAARYLGVPLPKDIAEQAQEYANMDGEGHARDIVELSGMRARGLSKQALFESAMHVRSGMHGTSDFALMMDAGFSTAVRAAHEAALSPLVAAVTIKRSASNFKPNFIHGLGQLPTLPEVPESGEIKQVSRGEARETWLLKTYGGIFAASRQLILGDEFNQLGDFARDAGQASAATVADLVVTEFTAGGGLGPLFSDGQRLFSAAHANYDPVAAAISIGSLSDARRPMLLQTGLDGVTIINVNPNTIIVAPSNLTTAEQAVAQLVASTPAEVNPFSQKLSVVCEPRLEAIDREAWYLSDSKLPSLVLGGLAGAEGPQISARDGFEILGREWRVYLDCGVGPYDWRGAFKHEGLVSDSNSGA